MVLNGGDFFWDFNSSQYHSPKTTDGSVAKKSIFSGGIWIEGVDQGENLHLAAMTYRQRGQDFWPGPSSNEPETSRNRHDRIYVVSQADILAHIADPSHPTADIKDWPGNGNISIGEPAQLAPYIDINENGVYEPTLGDYPKIKGYIAAYCIYNDFDIHTETGGEPLNFDIHQMFYQEQTGTQNAQFDHVNLAYFKVINRSIGTIKNIKFGVWVDFDLGNFQDDFVGSDSVRNMIYAYNGDDNDEGVRGYGLNPPAQNMMFLNKPLYSAVYYGNDPNPIDGNPTVATDYSNFLNAKWRNGEPIRYGGNPGVASPITRYMWSGDPVTNQGWTEENYGGQKNTPGDRRMLGTVMLKDLAHGESDCVDIAFVFARPTFGGALQGVTAMREVSSHVQFAYNQNFNNWKDFGCQSGNGEVAPVHDLTPTSFKVYPNPSQGMFYIQGLENDNEIHLTNAMGQEIKNYTLTGGQLNLQGQANGIYFLKTNEGSIRLLKM